MRREPTRASLSRFAFFRATRAHREGFAVRGAIKKLVFTTHPIFPCFVFLVFFLFQPFPRRAFSFGRRSASTMHRLLVPHHMQLPEPLGSRAAQAASQGHSMTIRRLPDFRMALLDRWLCRRLPPHDTRVLVKEYIEGPAECFYDYLPVGALGTIMEFLGTEHY